ncbi:MAG: 50S ribosomal protein L27 [Candidatus Pacebacteria bacterium]|nr:50S ribosomal protein L27 [Candidatus Paceibacterota bacterium]
MATTKAAGTSRLGRDSNPKYLGVKLFEGQSTKIGSIIIRQRGSKVIAGKNVRMGKDNTLYAVKAGKVSFSTTRKKCFDGSQRIAKVVSVE